MRQVQLLVGTAQKNTKNNPMWGIFIFGFSEPLGIKYEGLASILHWSELFVKFQFGVVCIVPVIYKLQAL